jgi:hypothetical protein
VWLQCNASYLLTYLLTELSPSWVAANCAATQELPRILRHPKVHHRVHKSPPLVPKFFPLTFVRWDFGYCGHYWPIVPSPDDRWGWLWRNWWNEDWQRKPKYSENTCPSATLSTTNPTCLNPDMNPGRHGGKPATNRLSYCAALHWSLSWARSIQSIPSHLSKIYSNIVHHLRLGLPSGLFPSGFPINILYAFLVSPIQCNTFKESNYWFQETYLIIRDERNSI